MCDTTVICAIEGAAVIYIEWKRLDASSLAQKRSTDPRSNNATR